MTMKMQTAGPIEYSYEVTDTKKPAYVDTKNGNVIRHIMN